MISRLLGDSHAQMISRLQLEPEMLVVREIVPVSRSERILLAAIIRRAAYDIALYRGDRRLPAQNLWRQAYNWVYLDDADCLRDHADRFMSFKNLCILLDRDPDETRQKIAKLNKKDVRQYDMFDAHGRV
jgi:hypothetical protein